MAKPTVRGKAAETKKSAGVKAPAANKASKSGVQKAERGDGVAAGALPALGSEAQTLPSLLAAFPAEDTVARDLALEDVSEEVLLDYGVSVDSQVLLDSVPGFVASAVRILDGLRPELSSLVLLDRGLLSVLVHQTAALGAQHAKWVEASKLAATVKTRDEQRGRVVIQQAMALRGRVSGALRNVLGPRKGSVVDTAASGGNDAVPLAGGLAGLAQLFRESRKRAKTAQAMARYGLDDAVLHALETSAAEVRGLAGPYTQQALKVLERELNLQDGRVIVVAEKIVRAFRLAHRSNPAVLLPSLGGLAWRLGTRSGPRAGGGGTGGEGGGEGEEPVV
jgi:hypothetical protein